ncbi:MAG: EAL domain-containing protein, partial [Alphaproteobacteria bacterium]|nr:EAL domain-containing protein [Alphaproteobacteria bacterium]
DIFGVILPESGSDLEALAKHILLNFHDRAVSTPSGPLHISVSIGGVFLDEGADSPQEVMIRAEHALQEARKNGRNQFVQYRESTQRVQESRTVLEIGERVKIALKQGNLRLAYQPIIDADSGQVLFYEALARMFREDGQLMPAAEFIPVVEQLGLALEFDRHVLDIAVRELEAHPTLWLAVNISGLTASQADWPEYMQRILGHRPDVARRLVIEITETAATMDVEETKRLVDTLNNLGSLVALDDFGAGATSIRHLRCLALSIMKIDRDLLNDVLNNGEQQHLVRMLIAIAHGLNLRTIAEGVETEDVAAWLRNEKVDMMQGYYFGRPTLNRPWLETRAEEAPEPCAESDSSAKSQAGTAREGRAGSGSLARGGRP